MMNILNTYPLLVSAIGTLVVVLIVQLLVADIVGILSKHTPGSSVKADHGDLLFRATRVVGNTNESIAIFILASHFCVFTGASAYATGVAAWVYVGSRVFYALCYYLNWQTARSTIFVISLIALALLLVIGARAWI